MTKFLNISTDNTLGGNSPSDVVLSSQKAIKDYIDNQGGGANTNLSNLTDAGKNIGNWSSSLTNCITEIPQDIQFELSAGTLTLKSGSRCYLKTDTTTPSVTIAENKTLQHSINGQYYVIYNGTSLIAADIVTYDYDTLPNSYTLPLGIITVSGNSISSIDYIFNGFGYIGHTVFVLPGLKGLSPNGMNENGTAKSDIVSVSSIKTKNLSGTGRKILSFSGSQIQDTLVSYNEVTNYNYFADGTAAQSNIVFAEVDLVSGDISQWYPKKVFCAADYVGCDVVIKYQRPTAENNYTWYRKYKSGWVEQGGIKRNVTSTYSSVTLPIEMSNINYTLINSLCEQHSGGQYSQAYQTSTTTFSVRYSGTGTTGVSWQVSGMAAS